MAPDGKREDGDIPGRFAEWLDAAFPADPAGPAAWETDAFIAGEAAGGSVCADCGRTIRRDEAVKRCPACGLVLHAACYDDPYRFRPGLHARSPAPDAQPGFATEGCEACRHRTYFR